MNIFLTFFPKRSVGAEIAVKNRLKITEIHLKINRIPLNTLEKAKNKMRETVSLVIKKPTAAPAKTKPRG